MNSRDELYLQKIVHYAEEIVITLREYAVKPDDLQTNFVVRNSLSMDVLQIGEYVGKLSEDFRAEHPEMPWQDIKSMRNVAAHNYGEFDLDILWATVTEDIPFLKVFCEQFLK